jgi:hypothetical protein
MSHNSGLMQGNQGEILGVCSDCCFAVACHSAGACDIARAE